MKTKKIESDLECFFISQRFNLRIESMMSEQVMSEQMNQENYYGNEVKRRRMNDNGEHLKVWHTHAHEISHVFKEEEQEPQQPEEPQQPQQPEEPPMPVSQLIGRTIVVELTTGRLCRGKLEDIFMLNGERAIQMQTSEGENFIYTNSQMHDVKVLRDRRRDRQINNEEMLSPIPRDEEEVIQIDEDNNGNNNNDMMSPGPQEVIQIDDDDNEVEQINRMLQVIEINDDSEDDDKTTVQMEYECEYDDFPDVQFQSARNQDQDQEEEEHECCAICFEITDQARNFVSLDCGHQFHFGCIMQNMATGGFNRNNCPMCRAVVNQEYEVHNLDELHSQHVEEMIERAAQGNQRLQDELDLTRQHREDLSSEYMRVMTMNMQIGMRHHEERAARDALERRAEMCILNERIASIVENAANNDLRRNQPGVAMHIERQIRELCMSFGMTAYDAQYDDEAQYDFDYAHAAADADAEMVD